MNRSVFQVDIQLDVPRQYTRPLIYMFIAEEFYNVLERYHATDIQRKHLFCQRYDAAGHTCTPRGRDHSIFGVTL